MLGYERIPDEWKSGIPAISTRKFAFTTYSFNDIVGSTLRRAEMVVARAGGRVDGDTLVIPAQSPSPPALEQWDMGMPDRIVKADDPAWRWRGRGSRSRRPATGRWRRERRRPALERPRR